MACGGKGRREHAMQKLAVSNIAWDSSEDGEAYREVSARGFGLEISPSRVFGSVKAASKGKIREFSAGLAGKGIEVVAMQALLYGRDDLKVFEGEEKRRETMGVLKKCVDIGAQVGAAALVFGSPRNRLMPAGKEKESESVAVDFFGEIGDYAFQNGVFFCVEPNPKEYGANFLCTTDEAAGFVKKVKSKGLKINLDCGAVALNGENDKAVGDAVRFAGHVHASEPFLAPLNGENPVHRSVAEILLKKKYRGAVSIEMKKTREKGNVEQITGAMDFLKGIYGG